MIESIDFVVEAGDGRRDWKVRFYDRADGQFYGGSDDTSAWLAIGWALDERAHRRAGILRIAHNPAVKVPTFSPGSCSIAPIVPSAEPTRLPLATAPCSAATRRSRTRKAAKRG